MNRNFISRFHEISISGRYIYGYLCLQKIIKAKSLNHLPKVLDEIIYEFVSSDRLDVWQQRADEVLPSIVIDETNNEDYYEFIKLETVLVLRNYYNSQPPIVKDLIEEIIGLGLSNLYCGFDSNITFPYIEQIVRLMEEYGIELPDFQIVEHCSVKERHGWGELTNMSDFLLDSAK